MPAPGEPAWTEDDVEYALQWQALTRDECPGCGHPRSETYERGNADAYAVTRLRCHACATREAADKEFSDAGGDTDGMHYIVRKAGGGHG